VHLKGIPFLKQALYLNSISGYAEQAKQSKKFHEIIYLLLSNTYTQKIQYI
jgi:hypothetical protein